MKKWLVGLIVLILLSAFAWFAFKFELRGASLLTWLLMTLTFIMALLGVTGSFDHDRKDDKNKKDKK